LFVLAACLLGTVAAAAAGTGMGAGVGADPIVLSQPARAGGAYALPSLYVVNTGSVTATYRITLQRLPGQHGLTVPPGWVQIAPSQVSLSPGRSIMVGLRLVVPKRATHGRYASGLLATALAGRGGTNVATGAAAATDLRFTIAGGAPPRSALPFRNLLLGAIPLLAGAAFLVWHGRGYSIRIERRGRH
jgi:hypothetical protein